MKRIALFLALVVLTFAAVGADGTNTFYVQLIRGTDTVQPPEPKCRRVGAKLAATFRPVFKWNEYWEINLQEARLRSGEKAKVRLSAEREVEIDLGQPNQRTITTFHKGKVTDRTICPTGDHMTIIGGNREPKSAWFIVVRRDKPNG